MKKNMLTRRIVPNWAIAERAAMSNVITVAGTGGCGRAGYTVPGAGMAFLVGVLV